MNNQNALGRNSKAVHYAYSKRAEVTVPSLDDWEKGWSEKQKAGSRNLELPKVVAVDLTSPADNSVAGAKEPAQARGG